MELRVGTFSKSHYRKDRGADCPLSLRTELCWRRSVGRGAGGLRTAERKAESPMHVQRDMGSTQLSCPEREAKRGEGEVKENLRRWFLFFK